MLKKLLNYLITWLFPKNQPNVTQSLPNPPKEPPKSPARKMEIDWTNPASKVSKYFTVKEATYLPSWNCYHIPNEEEKANIIKLAESMDKVREYLGLPITITVWIRPNKVVANNFDPKTVEAKTPTQKQALAELDYNKFIGGAKMSAHRVGLACDWYCRGVSCDEIRQKLLNKLEEFDIRVEDLPNSKWVHTDKYNPSISGGKRFFKP